MIADLKNVGGGLYLFQMMKLGLKPEVNVAKVNGKDLQAGRFYVGKGSNAAFEVTLKNTATGSVEVKLFGTSGEIASEVKPYSAAGGSLAPVPFTILNEKFAQDKSDAYRITVQASDSEGNGNSNKKEYQVYYDVAGPVISANVSGTVTQMPNISGDIYDAGVGVDYATLSATYKKPDGTKHDMDFLDYTNNILVKDGDMLICDLLSTGDIGRIEVTSETAGASYLAPLASLSRAADGTDTAITGAKIDGHTVFTRISGAANAPRGYKMELPFKLAALSDPDQIFSIKIKLTDAKTGNDQKMNFDQFNVKYDKTKPAVVFGKAVGQFGKGSFIKTGTSVTASGIDAAASGIDLTDLFIFVETKDGSAESFEVTGRAVTAYKQNNVSIIAGKYPKDPANNNFTLQDTNNKPGAYLSLGVVSGTNADADVAVLIWFDATNKKLKYTYKTKPQKPHHAGAASVPAGEAWAAPKDVFGAKNIGAYCKLTVDKKGGIHIAAYSTDTKDLHYAYLSKYDADAFKTCVVDSYGITGTQIRLDVALSADDKERPIPYIGYYSASAGYAKLAYRVTPEPAAEFDQGAAGVDGGYFTGNWEVTCIPTTGAVVEDNINVGVWKNADGKIKASVAGTNSSNLDVQKVRLRVFFVRS